MKISGVYSLEGLYMRLFPLFGCSGTQHPPARCLHDGMRAIISAQFNENVLNMVLYREDTRVKNARNFAICLTVI